VCARAENRAATGTTTAAPLMASRDCTALELCARDMANACQRDRRPPSSDELRELAQLAQSCELPFLALVLGRAARAIVPIKLVS